MPLILSLKGKIALVTGGANGIGEATAKLLQEADAQVIVFDIDEPQDKTDSGIHFIHCDMGDKTSIDHAYQQVIERFKKVDILINNVGVEVLDGHILEMSESGIAHMQHINVDGPFHLTRLAMKDMRQNGGCITFVSSTQADVVEGAPSVYNIQKNTILGMAKAFAVAGGSFGIRVNSVSPGAIATKGMGSAELAGKERLIAINHKTPLGRRGHPQEVAHEIVNLCFATYTTGDRRTVDGGFSKVALAEELTPVRRHESDDPDQAFLEKN